MVELAIHTRNNRRSSQLSSVLQVIWILCIRTNCFQLLAVRDLIHIASHPAFPYTARKTIYQKKKSMAGKYQCSEYAWESNEGVGFVTGDLLLG